MVSVLSDTFSKANAPESRFLYKEEISKGMALDDIKRSQRRCSQKNQCGLEAKFYQKSVRVILLLKLGLDSCMCLN